MQFRKNRRYMLAQDVVLVCLLPVICFLSLGSLRIGSWYTGDMITVDLRATEMMEETVDDFYIAYMNDEGDELGETVSFSPLGIWKSVGEAVGFLLTGRVPVSPEKWPDISEDVFASGAKLLFIPHLIGNGFSNTLYQGPIWFTLFVVLSILPVLVGIQFVRALIALLSHRNQNRERHRRVVLAFRVAMLPFFAVFLMSVLLPEVHLSTSWMYVAGVFLLCLLFQLMVSRLKRNTSNEKEYLNFIQITSLVGFFLMAVAVAALCRSCVITHLYERIYAADGMDILLDCFQGDFQISKILMLCFVALFMMGVGFMVRYIYYTLLRVACLLESTSGKRVEREGMVGMVAVSVAALASVYFLLGASGLLKLRLNRQETIALAVAFGLMLLTLITEIVQRILCYANRIDREYRNDLLCGCTEDRIYNVEAEINDTPMSDESVGAVMLDKEKEAEGSSDYE